MKGTKQEIMEKVAWEGGWEGMFDYCGLEIEVTDDPDLDTAIQDLRLAYLDMQDDGGLNLEDYEV